MSTVDVGKSVLLVVVDDIVGDEEGVIVVAELVGESVLSLPEDTGDSVGISEISTEVFVI